ncbi:DUF3710 domain-containing protein [Saccharopolyspora rectivirgula]|jgi:hypothetical protein|uniref:DUF3710 domain-containing protein n=1 Tax=Saccharopolyspora rectivirgula TaxID=28042 RepID=A0A073B2Z7_9PSEU|nr:DUF3710 domain-containing protein [Saccharopolyspora rectivirgula]KEI45941.1 hypothetical protein GU90_01715 [Saccharopolyspora rectivirgula]
MFRWGRRKKAAEPVVEQGSEDESVVEELPEHGPYDEAEAPEDGLERLDLGSVKFPVPEGAQLQVEVDPSGPVRAVHVVTELGRLTVSAFAAPRSTGVWDEVRAELIGQLQKDGARVRTEPGDWGEEVVADTNKAVLRFVGVDGPRWLVRGVAASPAEHARDCAKTLYKVLDDTIVVRGQEPMPVRAPLPIQLPEQIMRRIQQAQEQGQPQTNGQVGTGG